MEIIRTAAECSRFRACCFSSAALRIIRYSFVDRRLFQKINALPISNGIKGIPVGLYNGTLVSDHESAIIKHGKRRQECMSHIRRYVIAGIETKRKWNRSQVAQMDKQGDQT